MARIAALSALLLCLSGAFFLSGRFDAPRHLEGEGATLEVKYRYLLVTVEGPADWVKEHRFSTNWQGKPVTLPVAFRVAGPAENVKLGAGPEILKYLKIGESTLPVIAEPETEFRVGNELGFGVHPEKSPRTGGMAFSLVHWVVVAPLDQPGEVSPYLDNAEVKRASNKVEKRLQQLLAQARVIDVEGERPRD